MATVAERPQSSHLASLREVFKLEREKFNLPRGLVLFAILIVPLIVLAAIDMSQYWLSVSFGALFVGLSDPGGEMGKRLAKMASVSVIGAFVTVVGSASARAPGGELCWRRSWSRAWPG